MNVSVIGASRGSGLAVVNALVEDGHQVTAFARTIATTTLPPGAHRVVGDVADPRALDEAMATADAVVVTLGISDNPLTVRLRRRAGSALDVRSAGTRAVVEAMRRHGVRRLVVQTTYGAGDSYAGLSLGWRATFRLVLADQLTDSDKQEEIVRASGLDWTLVRPVSLADGTAGKAGVGRPGPQSARDSSPLLVSDSGEVASMKVSRGQVAATISAALADPDRVGATLAVSAGSLSGRR